MTPTYEAYYAEISSLMTQERADVIRHYRAVKLKTYIEVSVEVRQYWGNDARWPKEGCRLAGEALCVSAARVLGEIPYKEPWA